QELTKRIMGSGGMYAYLGTKDIRDAEKRAAGGDEKANVVLNAMAYQVAKEIGAMSAVLSGDVDGIVLTGGIAYSQRIVAGITSRVKFIAPTFVVPGEEELEALAQGAIRVLQGEEEAQLYSNQ
ncbi:MAG: butyrate kinase, partial [Sporomusaceae bacterium]|nr:butyrate kinase [Sporomusaceae bacterium]